MLLVVSCVYIEIVSDYNPSYFNTTYMLFTSGRIGKHQNDLENILENKTRVKSIFSSSSS